MIVISILKTITLIKIITFYMILINTLFLFYLQNIGKLKIYFNNTYNKFIKRIINSKERIKVF